ncbi:cadherin-23-like [Lingula anatina]|uniref:Cadherin-23-like n=1 Tax=Lingula anatina TaxID=7574 RepID=A0A1S3I742_LINAN|nr:cadherin-23-like [Lingula anatina]|eukprot:XP_013394028.2 cadherin-23-like [Lingula anatina]
MAVVATVYALPLKGMIRLLCAGHGACLEPNLCNCDPGFGGNDCSNFSCEALGYCSGNGQCVLLDMCLCSPGWLGERCDEPVCSDVANCSGNGSCVSPNLCECLDEYDGVDCSIRIGSNYHSPMFAYNWYNGTVPENAPPGTIIVFQENITMINATDLDTGRNGKLEYTFSGSNGAERFFNMDSQGQLSVVAKLDYDSLPQEFIMTVVASDKGVPPKSAATKVAIIVQDVNDNAPVFQLVGFPDIPVNASGELGRTVGRFLATDKDSGSYGTVRHSITNESNPDAVFAVNEDTGELSVVRYPVQYRYDLTILAEDGGEPPKSAILPVVISVYGHLVEGRNDTIVVNPTTNTVALVSTTLGSSVTTGTPGKVEGRNDTVVVTPTTSTVASVSTTLGSSSTTGTAGKVTNSGTVPTPKTTTTQATVVKSPQEAWYQTVGFKAGAGAVGGVVALCLIAVIAYRCIWGQKYKGGSVPEHPRRSSPMAYTHQMTSIGANKYVTEGDIGNIEDIDASADSENETSFPPGRHAFSNQAFN